MEDQFFKYALILVAVVVIGILISFSFNALSKTTTSGEKFRKLTGSDKQLIRQLEHSCELCISQQDVDKDCDILTLDVKERRLIQEDFSNTVRLLTSLEPGKQTVKVSSNHNKCIVKKMVGTNGCSIDELSCLGNGTAVLSGVGERMYGMEVVENEGGCAEAEINDFRVGPGKMLFDIDVLGDETCQGISVFIDFQSLGNDLQFDPSSTEIKKDDLVLPACDVDKKPRPCIERKQDGIILHMSIGDPSIVGSCKEDTVCLMSTCLDISNCEAYNSVPSTPDDPKSSEDAETDCLGDPCKLQNCRWDYTDTSCKICSDCACCVGAHANCQEACIAFLQNTDSAHISAFCMNPASKDTANCCQCHIIAGGEGCNQYSSFPNNNCAPDTYCDKDQDMCIECLPSATFCSIYKTQSQCTEDPCNVINDCEWVNDACQEVPKRCCSMDTGGAGTSSPTCGELQSPSYLCSGGNYICGDRDDCVVHPTSMEPTEGDSTTTITITGHHFGNLPGTNGRVIFQGRCTDGCCLDLEIKSWSNERITVGGLNNIPTNCLNIASQIIVMSDWQDIKQAGIFTILDGPKKCCSMDTGGAGTSSPICGELPSPSYLCSGGNYICGDHDDCVVQPTSMEPTEGDSTTTITITGHHFGNLPGTNGRVIFYGTCADGCCRDLEIKSWSNGRITVGGLNNIPTDCLNIATPVIVLSDWNDDEKAGTFTLRDSSLSYCGDGVKQNPNDQGTGGPLNDGNEECDGSDFGSYTGACSDYDSNYISGDLQCDNCGIDVSDCSTSGPLPLGSTCSPLCSGETPVCDSGTCVCRTSPDSCDTGKTCQGGVCVPDSGGCQTSADCKAGLKCQTDGTCSKQLSISVRVYTDSSCNGHYDSGVDHDLSKTVKVTYGSTTETKTSTNGWAQFNIVLTEDVYGGSITLSGDSGKCTNQRKTWYFDASDFGNGALNREFRFDPSKI